MILALLRPAIFTLFLLATMVAIGTWAVRTQRIQPFSGLGRTIRTLTDPIIEPLERWLLRRGGNPQHAGWWLMGIALVGGILLITLLEWLASALRSFGVASARGPRGVAYLLVFYAGQLIIIALIVRVIGSWLGAGRYNKWVRWSYRLTDWCIEPLRKIIPPIGMIDITPLVVWFLLQVVVLPLLLGILR